MKLSEILNLLVSTLFFISLVQFVNWANGQGIPAKIGECPPSDPTLHCYEHKDLCQTDCECPRNQKCCYQEDCGFSCKDPTVMIKPLHTCNHEIISAKRGKCPKPYGYYCIHCIDQCRNDCECPGGQKCCVEPRCGNLCRNATETVTQKPCLSK